MPTLEQWGPSTWVFFHTMAAKMHPESFPIIGKSLMLIIIQIASNLPCPECTMHAKSFFTKMNPHTIQTKQHLINMLHTFHNSVNQRTNKKFFHHKYLDQTYNNLHLIKIYNNFIKYFHTKGNMQMLTETFHRTRLVSNIHKWMIQNIKHFIVFPIYSTLPTIHEEDINVVKINTDDSNSGENTESS